MEQRLLSGEDNLRSASSLLLAFFNAFPPVLRKGQQSSVKIMKTSRRQSIGSYLEKEGSSQMMESAGGIEKTNSWDEGWQD